MTPMYFRSSAAAIVVYDITSSISFSKAQYWVEQFRSHYNSSQKAYLVGNKLDLESNRAIEIEKAQKFAKKNELKFFEVSAKSGKNINELFESLTLELITEKKQQKEIKPQEIPEQIHSIAIDSPVTKNGCC
ncbi:ras-related protein rab-37 [Anaeramoeba ignava]|uniref:Ras-related protein rab-37 n=1 Tax=Anaeramoeba ignava TaxID=1746090 RepID=A0A9Q0L6C9_ANAIG|nr:ras-related protein rab-37 [Anaeramoeba ignava]